MTSTTVLVLLCLLVIAAIGFWMVATPKKTKLQPTLEARSEYNYKTPLMVTHDSSLQELLLLRRLRDSEWKTSGEHTDYKVETRIEPSMAVSTIRPDAYLKKNETDAPRIIIGRYTDRGSGMHGWHVTMIKQGESEIDFNRHQRYYVWIEKDYPTGFTAEGHPLTDDPKRWFFAGLADIISKEKYNGYIEPGIGDK